jgi:hypothetical protein
MSQRFQNGNTRDQSGACRSIRRRKTLHRRAAVIQPSNASVTIGALIVTGGVRMTDFALNSSMAEGAPIQPASRPNLDMGFNPLTMILFFGILAAGLLYVTYSIYADVDATGTKVTTYLPYLLLMIALLIRSASSSSTASTTPPTPSRP